MMLGMGFGLIILALFWGGLIVGAELLVRALFSGSSNRNMSIPQFEKSPDALDILNQRYTRGEITREQYEIMKQDIG